MTRSRAQLPHELLIRQRHATHVEAPTLRKRLLRSPQGWATCSALCAVIQRHAPNLHVPAEHLPCHAASKDPYLASALRVRPPPRFHRRCQRCACAPPSAAARSARAQCWRMPQLWSTWRLHGGPRRAAGRRSGCRGAAPPRLLLPHPGLGRPRHLHPHSQAPSTRWVTMPGSLGGSLACTQAAGCEDM